MIKSIQNLQQATDFDHQECLKDFARRLQHLRKSHFIQNLDINLTATKLDESMAKPSNPLCQG